MSRLIDADKIDFNEVFGGQSDFAKDTRGAAQSLIDAQPTVEAVPKSYAEQIRWERDVAVGQLNEIGCQFGQKMDEVKDKLNSAKNWIPCSERMPDKEYELYWTTHEDGSIVLHGYTKKNGFIYNWEVDDLELRKRQGRVVAWMLIPMPEPYKGE